MRKFVILIFILTIASSSFYGCAPVYVEKTDEYGGVKTAILNASDKIYGKYPNGNLHDLTLEKYKQILQEEVSQGNYPKKHYEQIEEASLYLETENNCLFVFNCDPKSNALIFCDFSCSDKPDHIYSPIEQLSCDMNNRDLYDRCKKGN
jgi:hypothetical protein